MLQGIVKTLFFHMHAGLSDRRLNLWHAIVDEIIVRQVRVVHNRLAVCLKMSERTAHY